MINPINERVLVLFEKAPDKTPGGIFIPDTAKEKPVEAKVIAVGAGRVTPDGVRVAPSVKPGDRVLIEKWATGTEVDIDGVKHSVVTEANIIGTVT